MACERVGGGRNNTGMWLACQMRDNGYSDEDTRMALLQFRSRAPITNSKGEQEGYSLAEIDATIKSIFGTPKRDSWNWHSRPFSKENTVGELDPRENTHQYGERNGGLIRLKSGRDGSEHVTPLTNFTARIRANVAEDDGVEVRRSFEIEARLRTRRYQFVIPASRFASMEWPIENMGAAAIVHPNQKDWARAAIQSLSKEIVERCIYAHTGWRKVGDRDGYLHAGGVIAASDIAPRADVCLSGALANYDLVLPDSPEQLFAAIRASLGVLDVASERVAFPLLAAVYRACICACDFAVWLSGPTGVFKSELAALAQQHYGKNMNARHLPGNFASTGNALEMLAFKAKDALLVVDDFSPQGSIQDISRYHATAERLLGAAGNNQGRERLSPDARLREAKSPRGLILATGEDVPRGQSIRGRTLGIELAPGEVCTDVLSRCQVAASEGQFVLALAGFIRWLAARHAPDCPDFRRQVVELRSRALLAHSRTPGIVADLYSGFDLFATFAVSVAGMTDEEKSRLTERCWEALHQVALAQGVQQRSSEPAERFVDLLRAAIMSGAAHVATTAGKPPADAVNWGWTSVGAEENQPAVAKGRCIAAIIQERKRPHGQLPRDSSGHPASSTRHPPSRWRGGCAGQEGCFPVPAPSAGEGRAAVCRFRLPFSSRRRSAPRPTVRAARCDGEIHRLQQNAAGLPQIGNQRSPGFPYGAAAWL